MSNDKLEVKTININVPYHDNPGMLFHQLCGSRPSTLLLESANIDNKQNLKSLLIVDSALRIIAIDNYVYLQALSNNGLTLLSLLDNILPNIKNGVKINERILIFSVNDKIQDEDSRLKNSSIFDPLRTILQLIKFSSDKKEAFLLGGLFAYDVVSNFEKLPKINNEHNCPDYCFYLSEVLLILDHQKKTACLRGSIFCNSKDEFQKLKFRIHKLQKKMLGKFPKLPAKKIRDMQLTMNHDDKSYCRIIRKMQKSIRLGEIFQVVPSRRFYLPCPSPLNAYNTLKKNNLSPYMFFMQDKDFSLFGASPESSLKYDATSRQIEIYPIAGTRPRGRFADGSLDMDLDNRIELEMRTNHKELSEHLMLVDLARSDLARICTPGTRHVANLIKVDRYAYVMHLVSRVIGVLRSDLDALHAYRACLNMGTLSGAPKVRAMQIIASVEGERRGSYGGSVGYLTPQGDLDTCIVIRSAYVKNGIATVQAGAGIVLDSNPQEEADESRNKARAVLNAIATAHSCKEVF
ncbi:anthranilate synthase component I [Candidatus Pantoea edessiphila]|uniref:Anthranilate synthase component 1 n=1 Tax=Candidatus Pantoea edessiphila TaxID=2044610 RepID=A0A2P5SYN8_9GAMM|nr:anthranilate synthase component 1 [Candidatus Pantoea edessiphila]MBK4775413.1 anthranilate synthase component 1 [Pantoea sp. Edef]PPI87457.1 anthranilate synthase component I [Candidatus Pantoea edessiphila]